MDAEPVGASNEQGPGTFHQVTADLPQQRENPLPSHEPDMSDSDRAWASNGLATWEEKTKAYHAVADIVRQYSDDLADGWNKGIDVLLVFAALYSAILTAFNVQSYQYLQLPSSEPTLALLQQISLQLESLTITVPFVNATYRASVSTTNDQVVPRAQAPAWAVALNIFWFSALILSLASTSIGILVKQWLHEYQMGCSSVTLETVRLRQLRLNDIQKWRVAEIVAVLPVLLQLSMSLFFAGLLVLLWQFHRAVAAVAAVIIGVLILTMAGMTIMPALYVGCSYLSPSAYAFRYAKQRVEFGLTSTSSRMGSPLVLTLLYASNYLPCSRIREICCSKLAKWSASLVSARDRNPDFPTCRAQEQTRIQKSSFKLDLDMIASSYVVHMDLNRVVQVAMPMLIEQRPDEVDLYLANIRTITHRHHPALEATVDISVPIVEQLFQRRRELGWELLTDEQFQGLKTVHQHTILVTLSAAVRANSATANDAISLFNRVLRTYKANYDSLPQGVLCHVITAMVKLMQRCLNPTLIINDDTFKTFWNTSHLFQLFLSDYRWSLPVELEEIPGGLPMDRSAFLQSTCQLAIHLQQSLLAGAPFKLGHQATANIVSLLEKTLRFIKHWPYTPDGQHLINGDPKMKVQQTIQHINARVTTIRRQQSASVDNGVKMVELQLEKLKSVETLAPCTTVTTILRQLHILYGSNQGTSKYLAQWLASDAPARGFRASIRTLDSVSDANLPKGEPIVIVAASFEGLPADNADHFVNWLKGVHSEKAFVDVKFSLFGCGNSDYTCWQSVPWLIDDTLTRHGATRLVERGWGGESGLEFNLKAFDIWENSLFKKLETEYGTGKSTEIAYDCTGGVEILHFPREKDMVFGTVVENELLTSSNVVPRKRHIELNLPGHLKYKVGDCVAIFPINDDVLVRRVMARFDLSGEEEIEINPSAMKSLPGMAIRIREFLKEYVELQYPARPRDLEILLKADNLEASTLVRLNDLSSNYLEKVFKTRLSVLDILEKNRDIDLLFSTFLQMLPRMRTRHYLISSSPLWKAQRVSLTISVDAPAHPGGAERFLGVASTYLDGLQAGDKVQLSVRASNVHFRPPGDPTIPLVMVAVGSGIAPMRAFLQERAFLREPELAGRKVAKSLLFFGCRNQSEDFLYGKSDLKKWAELGLVDVRPAFSQSPVDSNDCSYVEDRILHDREEVSAAFKQGAKIYVCGTGRIAAAVKKVFLTFIKEQSGVDDEGAVRVFGELMKDRYATEIFD